MRILGLDHIQLAIPRDGEEVARAFYVNVLGLAEVPKPAALVGRGGLWLTGGTLDLHLGIEDDFRPARKAHPGILVDDLAAFAAHLERHGCTVTRDVPLDGYDRLHVTDPFGNRIELLERLR